MRDEGGRIEARTSGTTCREREREGERERERDNHQHIYFVRAVRAAAAAAAAAAKNATLRLEKMDWASSGRAAPRRGKEI